MMARYKSDYNNSTMTTGSIDPYASNPVMLLLTHYSTAHNFSTICIALMYLH